MALELLSLLYTFQNSSNIVQISFDFMNLLCSIAKNSIVNIRKFDKISA